MGKRKRHLRFGERTMFLDDFLSREKNDDYDKVAIFFREKGYCPDEEISEYDFQELRREFKEIYGF